MNLTTLEKTVTYRRKRVGQGHGSGRGKTSGRGTKGAKARGDVPMDFEGGALPLMKRLPFLRGKGKNKVFQPKPVVLNVSALNKLPKNTVVDVANLVKLKLVAEKDVKYAGVKILGDGDLSVALTVKVPVSKSAAEKIAKAGGSVDSNSKTE